jgi:hypothetical protein
VRGSRIFRAGWKALVVLALAAVPAFAADTVVDIFQAEDAAVISGKRVEPVTVFYSNGRIEKEVNLAERATKVVVKADTSARCGDQWPHMVVAIDGVDVLSTFVQKNGFTAAPVELAPGKHTVSVRYDNDYYEPTDAFATDPPKDLTCDRNLLVDAVGVFRGEGTAAAGTYPATTARRPERHPVDGGRREGLGRLALRQPLARQQRVGQLQLRRPFALRPGHRPRRAGPACVPHRGARR